MLSASEISMGLSFKLRLWPVLLVFAIVVSFREKISCDDTMISTSNEELAEDSESGEDEELTTEPVISETTTNSATNEESAEDNHNEDSESDESDKEPTTKPNNSGASSDHDIQVKSVERTFSTTYKDPAEKFKDQNSELHVDVDGSKDEKPIYEPDHSEKLLLVMVIGCLLMLVAICVFLFLIYQRKKIASPVTLVDYSPNEFDTHVKETPNTSQPNKNGVRSLHGLAGEDTSSRTVGDPNVNSDMEQGKLGCMEGLSNRVKEDETKANIEAHTAEPVVCTAVSKPAEAISTFSVLKADVVEEKDPVGEPKETTSTFTTLKADAEEGKCLISETSKVTSTSSTLKVDAEEEKVLDKKGYYLPDQVHSLVSHGLEDINARETAAELPTRSSDETVSETPM